LFSVHRTRGSAFLWGKKWTTGTERSGQLWTTSDDFWLWRAVSQGCSLRVCLFIISLEL